MNYEFDFENMMLLKIIDEFYNPICNYVSILRNVGFNQRANQNYEESEKSFKNSLNWY